MRDDNNIERVVGVRCTAKFTGSFRDELAPLCYRPDSLVLQIVTEETKTKWLPSSSSIIIIIIVHNIITVKNTWLTPHMSEHMPHGRGGPGGGAQGVSFSHTLEPLTGQIKRPMGKIQANVPSVRPTYPHIRNVLIGRLLVVFHTLSFCVYAGNIEEAGLGLSRD